MKGVGGDGGEPDLLWSAVSLVDETASGSDGAEFVKRTLGAVAQVEKIGIG